jgi:hypothetical protein
MDAKLICQTVGVALISSCALAMYCEGHYALEYPYSIVVDLKYIRYKGTYPMETTTFLKICAIHGKRVI